MQELAFIGRRMTTLCGLWQAAVTVIVFGLVVQPAFAFPVTIDATALTGPGSGMNDANWGVFAHGEDREPVKSYDLGPGQYLLRHAECGNPTSVAFEIDSSGLFQYSPALDSILSGRGTSVLIVDGATVTVDASTLTGTQLWDVNCMQPNNADGVKTMTTLPGTPSVRFLSCNARIVDFTIENDGTVSFDPSLGYLSGAGTDTLTIEGLQIELDGTALTGPRAEPNDAHWEVCGATDPAAMFDPLQTIRVIPGLYFIRQRGCTFSSLPFTVGTVGTVDFDTELDGILSGRGSASIVVHGVTVTIDASALTGISAEPNDHRWDYCGYAPLGLYEPVKTATVIPGNHLVRARECQTQVTAVTVDLQGNFDYPPTSDTFLRGRGSSLLTIDGLTVVGNVTAAPETIPWYICHPFTSDSVKASVVLPGAHRFLGAADNFQFVVSDTGTVSYDPSLSDRVFGAGGDTLYIGGPPVTDSDDDGVNDEVDNCPTTPNPDQVDRDDDGLGDACDPDDDGDGINDGGDNCPDVSNPDQLDTDLDGAGDACDDDDDDDLVPDQDDNCPSDANPDQADSDGDGLGDACDGDDDNDGVGDELDNCPVTPNPDQADADGNGEGDVCDGDVDGDGVANEADLCSGTPLDRPVNTDGCSGVQIVERECRRTDFPNRGQYVRCVSHVSRDAVDAGLLTREERSALIREAAQGGDDGSGG